MTQETVTNTEPKRRIGLNLTGPGPGRPKGVPNKMPVLIHGMVVKALEKAGGVNYLVERALDPRTASAFLGLVSRILPYQITGANGRTLAQELAGLSSLVEPAPLALPSADDDDIIDA